MPDLDLSETERLLLTSVCELESAHSVAIRRFLLAKYSNTFSLAQIYLGLHGLSQKRLVLSGIEPGGVERDGRIKRVFAATGRGRQWVLNQPAERK